LANPRAVRIGKALFAKALTDTRPRSVRWHAHHGPWRLQAPAPFQQAIAAAGSTVYLYDWNQTVLDPFLTQVVHRPGTGPIHTSEFAYIVGNLSHYDTGEYKLEARASRSWSTFASTGGPSLLLWPRWLPGLA
jgi:carboxylesterase type B